MSHFGRSGPPDIKDTFSLLVLNITFRTTADDLFPLFDKYGKVVDVFIPRDRRTGDSRGFAFVRYKYQDEAQKAVEKLDGRLVDGREIMVQFAKYGPNAERIHKGRIEEALNKPKGSSRSRSPRRRSDYRDRDHRRRSRSRSRGRSERHRGRDRDRYRSRSRSRSPSRSASPGYRRDRVRDKYDDEKRRRSRSNGSASPVRRSPSPRRSPSLVKTPPSRGVSPDARIQKERSITPGNVSPRARRVSRSPSPHSEADVKTESLFLFDLVTVAC
ncbi:serine/arginine-rich splicing factor sc35 [Phtheirospermum japonicum]|uniref:Serine/arginine-rich splicing factor sc35 n=1 Tax=Phtheirospermum japonicum TaxID=374723 RepID=A0A830CB81_9LAMI|nr:serine/arginine-rich splicing factor sc35 [Phtheirospermum japonicum]